MELARGVRLVLTPMLSIGPIEVCGLNELVERRSDTLSGGRAGPYALCARALCRGPQSSLPMSRPAALDPQHALQLMGILRNYAEGGGAVLVILHDLALAGPLCN